MLTEWSNEQLTSRAEELRAIGENPGERTTEELEQLAEERQNIDAEIESRKRQAAQEQLRRDAVAAGDLGGNPVAVMQTAQEEEEKRMEINSAEYRSLWLRNLQGTLDEAEKRAYSSTSTNAVPTMIADKFFEKMKKLAPMLSEITLMRVAGNLKFVAEGTRNTATAKHTENQDLSASADTTVSVTLGAYEFMKVIQISRTARMMSIDAFEGWLIEMLAGDIARSIDDYILNDATNGVKAITFTTGTNQILNTATTGYTYDNIVDLIALLPAAYDAEAKFLVNKKTLYGQIAKIKDTTNNPIFVPDTLTGIGGRLMGYPVVVDDYVANTNNALYLGKWTDVVGNLPEDIHVDSDESAGFTSNSVMYRGIAVFDSKPAKTDAIVRLVSTTA